MRIRTLLTAAVTAVLLAGCTGNDRPAAPAGADAGVGATGIAIPAAGDAHNAADVMFLQMMIGHHGQGLEMSKLAAERAVREEVRQLAGAIAATQAAEIDIMRSWLTGWGEKTTADHDMSAHSDHGGLPATGPEQIAALASATGAEFETKFLSLMAGHQGAAAELTNLVATGRNVETREIARRIKESRNAQIAQMLALMNG